MRLFLSSLRGNSSGTPPLPPDPELWVLPDNSVRVTILTGQSNSSGEGYNASATTGELDETTQLILWRQYTNAFANLNIGAGNNYPNTTSKHGIELQLSNLQEGNYDYPLYLLKWGVGGTEILEHLKGGTVHQQLYNNFVYRGINHLLGLGKRVFVDFIFIQGEADSDFTDKQSAYSINLDALFTLWRGILGANLPISLVQIKQRNAGTTVINDIFDTKISSTVKVIEASALATNDGIHYSYDSLKTIANNYFDRIKTVAPLEILSTLSVPIDTLAPATMTLTSVTQIGSTLTVVADISSGDAVTSASNLYFKLYGGATIYHISGSDTLDANVSISGTTVTIVNIPVVYRFNYNMTIVAVDEAGNNSIKSNIITATVTP